MAYERVIIEIEGDEGGPYAVRLVAPDGAEERAALALPFDAAELETLGRGLGAARHGGPVEDVQLPGAGHAAGVPPLEAAEALGRALFDALLPPAPRALYYASRRSARDGLRLRLGIGPTELAAWPWELLFDPVEGEFVCLHVRTPIVRYLSVPQPRAPLAVSRPLRVLAMAAEPGDLGDLDVDAERQRLEEALAPLVAAGDVVLHWVPGATWRHLQNEMLGGGWHVFHFIGHGRAGHLVLAGDDGEADDLSARDVGLLLGDQEDLRLALLNACQGARASSDGPFGSVAETLVQRGLPAVVAMQNEITDRAAIEFARAFYEALARRQPIDVAVAAGRKAIWLAADGTLEWATPVLFMHAPDAVLFAPDATTDVGGERLADDAAFAAHAARAATAAEAGDSRAAIAAYTDAIELRPNDPDLLAGRGMACISHGRYAQAVEDLGRAMAVRGDDAELLFARGRAYYLAAFHDKQVGSLEQAIADFGRALELRPDDARVLYARGSAHLQAAIEGDRAEDFRRAADDFTRAVALDPEDGDTYFQRGRAYQGLGEAASARADFEQAVLLGSVDAERELGLLQRIRLRWRSRRPG